MKQTFSLSRCSDGGDTGSTVRGQCSAVITTTDCVPETPSGSTGGKVCSTTSLMRVHPANHGLNSILDGLPPRGDGGMVEKARQSRGIRRSVLRQFYGNSVNSPNLTSTSDPELLYTNGHSLSSQLIS